MDILFLFGHCDAKPTLRCPPKNIPTFSLGNAPKQCSPLLFVQRFSLLCGLGLGLKMKTRCLISEDQ